MPLFHYQALDSKGKTCNGHVEALTEKDVRDQLRAQGYFLTALQCKNRGSRKPALQGADLLSFTMQLTQLLDAGLPLYESLLTLEEHTRNEKWHHVVFSLCEKIKAGLSLSQAMEEQEKSFDRLYVAMIAAGESTGSLIEVCGRLTQLLQRQSKMKKQLTTAMLYPMVLLSFSLVVIALLFFFVVPSIEALFEGRILNGLTQFVVNVSHLLKDFWPAILLALSISAGAGCLWFQSKAGRDSFYRILHHLPIIKKVLLQSALGRFSRTMSTLQKGGVNFIDSLRIARRVMQNPLLESVIEKSEKKIIEGSSLSIELKRCSLIPHLIPRMLAVGEESGQLDLVFQKIAELYEEEMEKTLARLTSLAQPVILLFMGGVVGIVMLAVLLPLTDASALMGG